VRILYTDVVRAEETTEVELGATFVTLDELLSQSDIVSMHTPLTPQTQGMLGAAEFARMRQGAYCVITGRGQTYDMDALCEALKSGHLAGAGIDVYNPEPPPMDHPILRLPNVICTPHMATGTVEAHQAKARAQFENLKRVLAGQEPFNVVRVSAS
jgi:phosphoglycerate dehydrogenase-like enzyme